MLDQQRSAPAAPNEVTTPPSTVLAVNRRTAAAMLGISERLLWTWTNSGRVPHARIGARVLYPVELLRAWLRKQTTV